MRTSQYNNLEYQAKVKDELMTKYSIYLHINNRTNYAHASLSSDIFIGGSVETVLKRAVKFLTIDEGETA